MRVQVASIEDLNGAPELSYDTHGSEWAFTALQTEQRGHTIHDPFMQSQQGDFLRDGAMRGWGLR